MIIRCLLRPPASWLAPAFLCLLGLACGASRPSAAGIIALGTPAAAEGIHSRIDDAHARLVPQTPSAAIRPAPVATLIRSTRFIWPYKGRVSSYFGPGHPLGIDIAVDDKNEAAIKASASGFVEFAGGDACCEYGYHVILDHNDGRATLYAHLSSLP